MVLMGVIVLATAIALDVYCYLEYRKIKEEQTKGYYDGKDA